MNPIPAKSISVTITARIKNATAGNSFDKKQPFWDIFRNV